MSMKTDDQEPVDSIRYPAKYTMMTPEEIKKKKQTEFSKEEGVMSSTETERGILMEYLGKGSWCYTIMKISRNRNTHTHTHQKTDAHILHTEYDTHTHSTYGIRHTHTK